MGRALLRTTIDRGLILAGLIAVGLGAAALALIYTLPPDAKSLSLDGGCTPV